MSPFSKATSCVPSRARSAPTGHEVHAERTASGIDRLGRESLQPHDDGVRRAVADAGRPERAVKRARHATDLVEQARLAQAHDEVEGRPHGTDRVGARGSYSDGEQLERRDVSAHSSSVLLMA